MDAAPDTRLDLDGHTNMLPGKSCLEVGSKASNGATRRQEGDVIRNNLKTSTVVSSVVILAVLIWGRAGAQQINAYPARPCHYDH
jgi:hypothetical protein